MEHHDTYIARSEGEGFSLIHKGNPLSKSNQTIEVCEALAKRFNLKIEAIWDGFSAAWEKFYR